MAKSKRYPLGAFLKQFSTEAQCREYLADMRWKKKGMCAQNVGADTHTGYRMDGISAPNAAIRFL